MVILLTQGRTGRIKKQSPVKGVKTKSDNGFTKILCSHVFYHKFALKGHGNEADFLGFLQKLVPHRSLTLPFEPFQFWPRIRGDIHNQESTPPLGESASRRLGEPSRRVGESTIPRLAESESCF